MNKKGKTDYLVQTVCRALDILENFKRCGELGVSELSKRMGLEKNNVFRLLKSLASRGYIIQNKDNENYSLGLSALELGQAYVRQTGLIQQARPTLEKLVKQIKETVYVGTMNEREVVYLDAIESSLPVRVVSRVGAHVPIHATAMGKVLIAYRSDDERDRSLPRELKRFTKSTITDRSKLIEQLSNVQRLGYVVENEELDVGVTSIGVPIMDYTSRVVGAISISGPIFRMDKKRINEEFLPKVMAAGKEISNRLGYNIGNS